MAASTLVPLQEYLETSYRPDRDWIDGEVKERNMGEGQHAVLQKFFTLLFGTREQQWSVRVLPEQRVQTSTEHYRIPDICVTRRSAPFEAIVHTAPLLCIEILSREDRMSEMQERVEDYLGMGVEIVWLVDPRRRKAFVNDALGLREAVEELTVPGTAIRVAVTEVFAELDELEGKAGV
ncbi:Uma2 family endonuclease [Tunturiibacter empetritectus]|uniref:Uma2 family endonuclease n=1 Tax=Tunturiibacter lichenicola TaxID=2051959 RepID=A0A852VL94_9BACT|nr:Uma2 family endonuclease [Edaphobacter lichenicola]NYF90326.1 Uma2 family endonuclease [Edaphobacter lichenicola]